MNARLSFMPEGGETGSLVRSKNWGAHPLGDPEQWPDTLKTTLGILFSSRHPMFLFWGPELFCFYNDAYMPSFGNGKHPSAMGMRGEECWPEIWPIIGPQIHGVMTRGEATWNVNHLVPIFRNGSIEDVYWTYGYSPVRELNGDIVATLVVCTETTTDLNTLKEIEKGREQLRLSEARLSSAVEIAKVGFYDWDITKNSVLFSEQMMVTWGIESGQPLEAALARIHPEDRAETVRLIEHSMRTRSPYRTEYRVIRPDGATIWVEAHGTVWANSAGEPTRFFGTSLDISERKEVEKRLENERAELRRAVNARDEFLSIASHELKTPLTSIRLQTQLTQRNVRLGRADALEPSKLKRLVEVIDHSVEKLMHLVDDMLDIARISSGRLTFTPERFDICELTREVVERLQPQATLTGTRLHVEACESLTGEWDRFRVDQVITNLVTNALRYGEGSPVHVRVEHDSSQGSALIRVIDQGPGVALENQERIFNKFERAIDSNSISGLGLGLHICREIVERHHGKVSIQSELGHGAEFRVELPLDAS